VNAEIRRSGGPIFVIGVERSGTTLLYSILANHPALYWLSRLDSLLPRAVVTTCVIRRVVERVRRRPYLAVRGAVSRSSGLVPPSECQPYWRGLFGWGDEDNYLIEDDHFDETKLDASTKRSLLADLKRRLLFSRKQRLLFKQTSLSLKLRYLDAIFPDALFLQVIRDPMDNLVSLARAKASSGERFWGTKIPGWRALLDADPHLQAAIHMREVFEIVERDLATLPGGGQRRFLVRYEDLVQDPARQVAHVLQFCHLSPAPQIEAVLHRIEQGGPPAQRAERPPLPGDVMRIVAALSERWGYAPRGG
jgi:hypothetical protein